jgi:UDP-N-acetylglucosamine 4-epimerase
VDNAVQANLLAALAEKPEALNTVYNVACGRQTSLNALFDMIRGYLGAHYPEVQRIEAQYGPFRKGDVVHSLADIGKAERLLGYMPEFQIEAGLKMTVDWFVKAFKK